MGMLVGLEGTTRRLPCQHVVTVEQAIARIQKRRAITAAGGNGALNVWRDDARQLRSEFMRYRQTLDKAVHPTLESLRAWLTKWWPELGREVEE